MFFLVSFVFVLVCLFFFLSLFLTQTHLTPPVSHPSPCGSWHGALRHLQREPRAQGGCVCVRCCAYLMLHVCENRLHFNYSCVVSQFRHSSPLPVIHPVLPPLSFQVIQQLRDSLQPALVDVELDWGLTPPPATAAAPPAPAPLAPAAAPDATARAMDLGGPGPGGPVLTALHPHPLVLSACSYPGGQWWCDRCNKQVCVCRVCMCGCVV